MRKFIFVIITLFGFGILSAKEGEIKSVEKYEIKNDWKFKQSDKDDWKPAMVPGTVHTDLLNNGMIDDPYFGINEKKIQWIGEKDWTYETSFEVPENLFNKKNINLVFMGLDTYAKVFLNDSLILSADNMFREWTIDVKKSLKQKNNLLRIEFRNVFSENLPKYENAPYKLMAFDNNDQADVKINMYSRKAGFHFGWDWGPRLITYGIWRPVFIEAWDDIKINDIFIVQKNVSPLKADINSQLEIVSDSSQKATLNIFVNNEMIIDKKVDLQKGINKINLEFSLENPRLWWTNGLGEQYLYNFNYRINSEKNISDQKNIKVGIRSIELVREKDSIGKTFFFKINGVPVFAKGANYIPQDNFQPRVTSERYKHIIKSAADANMNILRIWGGGIYEEDEFYNLCDEYGILVWQDFMFACGMYPADDEYLDNVRNEVYDNVIRIRNHASLAMYCGNNENEIAWFQWGWKDLYNNKIQKQYEADYKKLFYETIPNALKDVDPTRYYHPSSPGAGFNNFEYSQGDAHYWSVWHGKEPFETYADNIARFMSEYGFQSYPEMSTIEKFTESSDRELHSEVMLAHQRCMADVRKDKEYGNRLIQWYMERKFNQPKDFQNYIYVAQVLQAEGVKMAIESHRRNMSKCMGTMYWQIDDCWPVASWSSMDYYRKWKALHYFVKKAYEQILISPTINKNKIDVYVVSDKLDSVKAELEIITMDFNGKEIYHKNVPVIIEPNSSRVYLSINRKELNAGSKEENLVVLLKLMSGEINISTNELFFKEPKDLLLGKPDIKINSEKIPGGYQLELSTNTFAKNVYLNTNEIGFFNNNFFDLFPGSTKKINFLCEGEIENLTDKIKIISLRDSF